MAIVLQLKCMKEAHNLLDLGKCLLKVKGLSTYIQSKILASSVMYYKIFSYIKQLVL